MSDVNEIADELRRLPYGHRAYEAADEIERLQARVRELEAALGTARTALIHTRAFATLRSLQIQMDEALLHIAAVSAETEADSE